jgi:hypothetical protein
MDDISFTTLDIDSQYSQVLQSYKSFIQGNYFAYELAMKFSKPLKVRARTPKVPETRRNEFYEPMYYIGKPIEFMPYPIHSRRNTASPQLKTKPDKKPKLMLIDPFNPIQKLNIQKCIESPTLNNNTKPSTKQRAVASSMGQNRPSTVVKTRCLSVSDHSPRPVHPDLLRKSNNSVMTNPDSIGSLTILNPRYKPNEARKDSLTIKIPTIGIPLCKTKRISEDSTFSAEKTHSRIVSQRPSLEELSHIEQRRKKYPWSRYYDRRRKFSMNEIDSNLLI